MSQPDRKRQRTDDYSLNTPQSAATEVRTRRSAFLASLNRGVSPPAGRESPSPGTTGIEKALQDRSKTDTPNMAPPPPLTEQLRTRTANSSKCRVVPSPFKLTRIRDVPANANVDTVGVKDILGDVMLREVWLFDFLYDVDWVMQQFDPDILPIVSVVLVHGSWRREDSNKIHIDEASKRYPNVKVVTAYMPEMYGCHHSKCMVLFRRDDLAQVIVHTANMIEQDWRNLTQGVWLSPLLPREAHLSPNPSSSMLPTIGSGFRFKRDFMGYLRHYGHRTVNLVSQLEQHDFSAIKAALIAHVPAKFDGRETEPSAQLWGWPALKRALESIPPQKSAEESPKIRSASHIICQVSSIASLSDKWIREALFSTLASTCAAPVPSYTKTPKLTPSNQSRAKFSIIFPTPREIRTCLDGYAAGASIHCKLQNAAQRKQFDLMKPHLCHWNAQASAGAISNGTSTPSPVGGKAFRGPAAPHIKTFIRFSNSSTHKEMDWALLTSANLSTQAWGTTAQAGSGEVRVSSYELGVLVWPDLFLEEETTNEEAGGEGKREKKGRAKMVPTFGSDTPTDLQGREMVTTTSTSANTGSIREKDEMRAKDEDGENVGEEEEEEFVVVGLRMPYDLPLTLYGPADEVWSARSSYAEPDIFGRVWNI